MEKKGTDKKVLLWDQDNNSYSELYLREKIPIPVFGSSIINKLLPFVRKHGNLKLIKSNMPNKKIKFSNKQTDIFKYPNIKTCILKDKNIPCGPINNISDVFKSEYANEMGFVCYGENSTDKRVPTVKNPVKFSKHEINYHQASPNHGEHKYDILRNFLGYTEDEIIELENKKVI